MKPTRQDVLLSIIAIALVAIAIKLIFFGPSTRGEMIAIGKIQNADEKKAAIESFVNRSQVVFVRGGDIEVSGSVDVSGSSVTVSGIVEIER
ncbi:MAG: hypothetical protein FD157_3379 [Rhodocyclaceae bacterium]|nr:MAG: hypothetical protein FD157_3379 [Rhodocyclaceae bacterium]TNC99405.1 MAG: hypothetical protein FD118_3775 [Rhodocyclaceae bacterium]